MFLPSLAGICGHCAIQQNTPQGTLDVRSTWGVWAVFARIKGWVSLKEDVEGATSRGFVAVISAGEWVVRAQCSNAEEFIGRNRSKSVSEDELVPYRGNGVVGDTCNRSGAGECRGRVDCDAIEIVGNWLWKASIIRNWPCWC